MTTEFKRLHDIAKIKAHIKHMASDTREMRDEARKLSGMDRWTMQQDARDNALSTRCLLLAYGYLRGKTISQMESPYSDPDEIPDAGMALMMAHAVWNQGPDGYREPEPKTTWQKFREFAQSFWGNNPDMIPKDGIDKMEGWEDFSAFVRKDIESWKAQVASNHVLRAAEKRVA